MINSSAAFQQAIVGDSRRIFLQAVINIIDPDQVIEAPTTSPGAVFSNPNQLSDKVSNTGPAYVTLERNRWILNGSQLLVPENGEIPSQVGFASENLSGDDGTFSDPPFAQINFSGVSILQACSVFFPQAAFNGVADTFTVEVLSAGTAFFTQTITGNRQSQVNFSGFTVQTPDAIKVTVSKWGLPGRRARIPEIIPGVYEVWDGSIIAAFNLVQQANFACTALPYGTCTLTMDNYDRRFEPRNKQGIFQSIEDRQGIDISIGCRLADGSDEFVPVGRYYQYNDGWKTGNNGLTMTWELTDIIGLIADREYIVPDTLPTTLSGWVGSIVAQLGSNFESCYSVDESYANLPLTTTADKVTGKKCGDILRWVCMATGTFPRADSQTGNLAVEPFWSEGAALTLDNLNDYPTMKANSDVAALVFTINGNPYVVSGTSTSASNTISIENPFITTEAAALTAARLILSCYGGNQYETVGRGNPASEIGDVDTVQLDESTATNGRRAYQTLSFTNGVLQKCQSKLVQPNGAYLFENFVLLTGSGNWTAPAGVTTLRLVLGQGGQGGGHGTDGTMGIGDSDYSVAVSGNAGSTGASGAGGKIWTGVVQINEGQTFSYNVGAGGAPSAAAGQSGQPGGETTFGAYSSANGVVYENGYTDIASGDVYGRTGVQLPLANSGDGGAGGAGGTAGLEEFVGTTPIYDSEGNQIGFQVNYATVVSPTPGSPGSAGGSGFALVYWDAPGGSA